MTRAFDIILKYDLIYFSWARAPVGPGSRSGKCWPPRTDLFHEVIGLYLNSLDLPLPVYLFFTVFLGPGTPLIQSIDLYRRFQTLYRRFQTLCGHYKLAATKLAAAGAFFSPEMTPLEFQDMNSRKK